tara:strand:+ start:10288 stop:11025 length:738 start_codon:yes stop_codon:yes gene_type:complete
MIQLPVDAFTDKRLKSIDLRVLGLIAAGAPASLQISEILNYNPVTIRRSVRRLVKCGYLESPRSRKRPDLNLTEPKSAVKSTYQNNRVLLNAKYQNNRVLLNGDGSSRKNKNIYKENIKANYPDFSRWVNVCQIAKSVGRWPGFENLYGPHIPHGKFSEYLWPLLRWPDEQVKFSFKQYREWRKDVDKKFSGGAEYQLKRLILEGSFFNPERQSEEDPEIARLRQLEKDGVDISKEVERLCKEIK